MTDNHKTITTRLLHFFSRLPMPISRFIAWFLAGLVNLLHITKTSETIRLNIEICFPDIDLTERERITKQAIRNELQSYMEFFSVWGGSNEKNISRIHHIQGLQHFHNAIEAGKGLVLIVPHFGTWEIMNAWVAQYTKMTIMYEPIKDAGADQFVRAARSRENATLVPTDESGVRQIFKALKQGSTTVILPDHSPHHVGELIEYFGVALSSSNLSAKLIQKTKAKALFLHAIRNDNDGFDMTIEPIDDEIYHVDANQGTRIIFKALENLIKDHPIHYHWSYKRFKSNPQLKNIYNIPKHEAIELVNSVRNGSIIKD